MMILMLDIEKELAGFEAAMEMAEKEEKRRKRFIESQSKILQMLSVAVDSHCEYKEKKKKEKIKLDKVLILEDIVDKQARTIKELEDKLRCTERQRDRYANALSNLGGMIWHYREATKHDVAQHIKCVCGTNIAVSRYSTFASILDQIEEGIKNV